MTLSSTTDPDFHVFSARQAGFEKVRSTFNMCSTYAHHANPRVVRRDYQGEVDYFGVFCVENRRAYLVPIAELPLRRQGRLRVDPLETINGDEFDSHQTSKSINVGQNTAPWFARETKGC
jgi:hypothetical protein